MRTPTTSSGLLLGSILLLGVTASASTSVWPSDPPSRDRLSRPRTEIYGGAETESGVTATRAQPTAVCGHDGMASVEYTLMLEPYDMAGIYADHPSPGSEKILARVGLGLLDRAQEYPTVVQLVIYERDDTDTYGYLAGFSIGVDSPPNGEPLDVDLAAFDLRVRDDLLLLFGDGMPNGSRMVLPAGDSSPRCFDGSNLCSVHLPAASGSLYIYGVQNPDACSPSPGQIQLYDLIVDLTFENVVAAAASERWGALKARY